MMNPNSELKIKRGGQEKEAPGKGGRERKKERKIERKIERNKER